MDKKVKQKYILTKTLITIEMSHKGEKFINYIILKLKS